MLPAMTTLTRLIYHTKRTTLTAKDIQELLTAVFYNHGKNSVNAFTYNGGDICYVWGHAGRGYGAVVVNATLNTATLCTPIDTPVLPDGWNHVELSSLRQCGALPHATA